MSILVVGSLNIDNVTYLERTPQPDETCSGDRLEIFSGGKGLNQAVADGPPDDEVTMIEILGNDNYNVGINGHFFLMREKQ